MFNTSMKFPKPRFPSPVPTARRTSTASPVRGASADQEPQAPLHRYLIRTEDFLTGGGEPMKRYSIHIYGTNADDASAKAMTAIETRLAPYPLPAITEVVCDMGCRNRDHA